MDLETASEISRPPSAFQRVSDRLFRAVSFLFAWATILVVLYIVWEIGGESVPAMKRYGFGFLTGRTWDPNTRRVRNTAGDLGDALQFAVGADDRHAVWCRRCDLPD